MADILFLIMTINGNIFRGNYCKKNFLLNFFLEFLKFKFNLEHFPNRMIPIADVFLNRRTPKNVLRLMSKESRFRGPSDKKHGKQVETLLKSERQHL